MNRSDAILQTKLNPPRLPRNTLVRPRVDALLRDALDYRVTIVQASTGYGKSTALANLADADTPLFWYSASEGDTDPQQFLAHVIAAFRFGLPALSDSPLALLQDAYAGNARAAIDALLNALNAHLRAPSLLVIDDYHLASSPEVNAWLDPFLTT
jgi:LuxR family maltose regulon positive regulatory protein